MNTYGNEMIAPCDGAVQFPKTQNKDCSTAVAADLRGDAEPKALTDGHLSETASADEMRSAISPHPQWRGCEHGLRCLGTRFETT